MGNTSQKNRENKDSETPTARAIGAFGSVDALAEAIGYPAHRIYRWRQSSAKGGRDGRVPDDAQPLILKAARARRLPLKAEDLIDMRPEHVRAREDVQ